MKIRKKIKTLIRAKNLSVRQLAEKSGVRRASLVRFLQGANLHLENLEKLLKALDCRLGLKISSPKENNVTMKLLKKRLKFNERKIAQFCKKKNIRQLSFFGSILRDDFKKDSDVDVLIEFEKPVTFFELSAIERELQALLNTSQSIDLVTLRALSPLLLGKILDEMEIIYEKAA